MLSLNLGSISTDAATLYLHRQRGGLFYWAELIGAVGHLCIVPFVAGHLQRIVDADKKTEATGNIALWISVHRVRMLALWLS
ncbi:hypothetical protein N7495_006149 [Penicillium taxi]|uniref:uncharacterized protein n=1 Tax=Penicillium taxi TaxID=168475 RepID=UPI0025456B02|nr:uncharacterized protein N7495_006149 [Penicillium taxi]KAJ5894458.1 hypothetical protein N7495_006149 [Penicillium taxi]